MFLGVKETKAYESLAPPNDLVAITLNNFI